MALTQERIDQIAQETGFANVATTTRPKRRDMFGSVPEAEQEIKPTVQEPSSALENAGKGAASALGRFGVGLLKAPVKIAKGISGAVGLPTDQLESIDTGLSKYSEMAFEKPAEQALETKSGKVGETLGNILPYMNPARAVSGLGKVALPAIQDTAVAYGQTGDVESALKTGAVSAVTGGVGSKLPKGLNTTGKGIASGYTADVASGLAGQRGEDREGVKALIPGLGTGLMAAGTTAVGGAKKANELLSKEGRVNRVIEKRGEAIDSLNKYRTLSTANEKALEKGIDIKDVLSKTDVLSGAVDNTGTINTKLEGGPIDQYTKRFIQGNEDIVSEALEKEGRFVNPDAVRIFLTDKVKNSGLQGRSLTKALDNIDSEIEGYKVFANTNGQIPVNVIHKAKVDKYSNINFMTDAEKQKYEKTIAKGLKEIVEKNTKSIDVKKVNEELSKHFAVVNYLEKLDGKKVDGGKLGKYFAQGIGAYIGGMTGGPLGAIAGAEIGSRTKGAMMSKTFSGKTGGDIPEGEAITSAKKYVGEDNIQLPQSSSEGNRYIPQSTTITNTINDIPESMPQDVGKSQIDLAIEKDRQLGKDMFNQPEYEFDPSIVKADNIHVEDARVMDKFMNYARDTGNAPDMTNTEWRAVEKLAEHFGISMDIGLKRLSDIFEDILSGKLKTKGTK